MWDKGERNLFEAMIVGEEVFAAVFVQAFGEQFAVCWLHCVSQNQARSFVECSRIVGYAYGSCASGCP